MTGDIGNAPDLPGIDSVSYPEAVEASLCYGWIDGVRRKLDEQYFVQRFTPRRPRSGWSKINCAKVDLLVAQGRMRPAGLRAVEAAKADGRWDAAYASPKTMTVPDDLRRELDKSKRARELFAKLDSRNRYAILYRLHDAKRPETRARRLAQFVAMLKRGETPYP